MNSFVYKGKVYLKNKVSCMHKEARLIQNMPTKQKGSNICLFEFSNNVDLVNFFYVHMYLFSKTLIYR